MKDASTPHEPRPADLQWLHALAARLVRDPHTADDAVQETLVRALERSPGPGPKLRAWLAAVLRNVARQEWRGRARRAAREAAAARGSAADLARSAPSTLDVVEELSLHRRLADEVQALDEPYRTAILLRYLRGRTPGEIARDLGVPVKTVGTRLERGLAKLRERMGRDRTAWAAFLAGVPPRGAAAGPTPLPLVLSMKAKSIVVCLGLSLLGGTLVLRASRSSPNTASETGASAALAPGTLPPAAEIRPAPRESARVEAEPVEESRGPGAPEPATPPSAARIVRGSVRALDGRALADVLVVLERAVGTGFEHSEVGPRARCGPDGRFELLLGAEVGRLGVSDERYACGASPHVGAAPVLGEPVLVVAPSRVYAGRVVDARGTPLARARVEIMLDGPIVQSRDVGGDPVHLLMPFAEGASDEQGAFRFERVGFVEGARLAASAEGFEPAWIELPADSHEHLELVLAPRAERTLHGIVLDASGAPAASALVSLGDATAVAGRDGTFTLDCESWRKEGRLRAVSPGAMPAELALDEALRPSSREHPLVLQLGAAPLAIRGRVLDGSGAPVPGAVVFSPDTTPFGSVVWQKSGHEITGKTTLEAFLNGGNGPWECEVHCEADADGGFVLAGLLERSYEVFALDTRTLDGAGPFVVRAGLEHAELRLPRGPAVPVAGRVVSRSGTPLAGVELTLVRHFDWRLEGDEDAARWAGFLGPVPVASWSLPSPADTTDDEGRFELPPLVTAGASLTLLGRALALGDTFSLDGVRDPGALEVVVDAGCRFQAVLRDADEADAFSLERADGRRVVMFIEVEGLTITADRAAIDAGRSGTVLVEEGEYEVVLTSGAEERRRERRTFPGGGLHEIRL